VLADELVTSKALVLLNYKISNDELHPSEYPKPMHYNVAQNLLVFEGGQWCVGKMKKYFRAEFAKHATKALASQQKCKEAAARGKQHREEAQRHREDEVCIQHMQPMRQQALVVKRLKSLLTSPRPTMRLHCFPTRLQWTGPIKHTPLNSKRSMPSS
jgi:hypothetical protein